MHRLIACLGIAFLCCSAVSASVESEVRAADDARISAIIAGDATRLDTLLSEQLSYGHADSRVEGKSEFLAATRSGYMIYRSYDYEERKFTPLSENVVTMSGRAKLAVSMGGVNISFNLRFLAIWQREDGIWQLRAYQSVRIPKSRAY